MAQLYSDLTLLYRTDDWPLSEMVGPGLHGHDVAFKVIMRNERHHPFNPYIFSVTLVHLEDTWERWE